MTYDEIIEILKSGDFTVVYHDRGSCTLYRGKFELSDFDDGFNDFEEMISFDNENDGYLPIEVAYLVDALNGKCDSY